MRDEAKITGAEVRVYRIPTDAHEADGTYSWDRTTMILVELESGSTKGIGYTYGGKAVATVANTLLEKVVKGKDAWWHAAILSNMRGKVRNDGETGITAMAISAIDNALWDLRARLLDVPLVNLLGRVRECFPVYGSGGFTSYNDAQLTGQLGGWTGDGFKMVKMKVGSHPADDPRRVRVARQAIGNEVELFVDANGAYSVMQALWLAGQFAEQDVRWFEEPVSADNLTGLREVRRRVPPGMDVAAGEYGYSAWYHKRMLEGEAITVLQADATRCCGISGFLDAAALCWAANVPISSHCAPSMHLHVCCAVPRAVHMEFFHDHARIERMFFDGFCEPRSGCMTPDITRPGHGLTLKERDAEEFRI